MVNDRHPSGTPLPTAPAPDASYGCHSPYGQQDPSYGGAVHDGYATGTFDHLAAAYGDGDPLFGAMPGSHDTGAGWDAGAGQPAGYDLYGAHPADQQGYGQHGYDGGYDTTGTWNTSGHQQPTADIPAQPGPVDPSGDATGQWGTGAWPAPGPWDTGQWDGAQFAQAPYGQDPLAQDPLGQDQYGTQQYGETHYGEGAFGTTPYGGGQDQYGEQYDPGHYGGAAHYATGGAPDGAGPGHEAGYDGGHDGNYDSGPYETTTHYGTTAGFETSGQWDANAWQSADAGWDSADGATALDEPSPGQVHTGAPEAEPERTAAFDLHEAADAPAADGEAAPHPHESGTPDASGDHGAYDTYGPASPGTDTHEPDTAADEDTAAAYLGSRSADAPSRRAGAGGRSRRRAPAKRSALLTVAVPSVAVMGVAGIAAASVGVGDDDSSQVQAAAEEPEIEASTANSKLDTQLATVTADADDFADRASRTQERIDLKKRQAEEKRRKAEEAARKEALRPKFALPVSQHGLSAYYGQAGVNWMSVHSGIDFPVSYGTPVMAATDGTVRTEYNIAYGNMAIVTAPDGTETWYCHLSSTKIRSGSVKAGDTIAYSGNSGNSTGPHLHFEVHPGGGSAINPLTWFQNHGLDPQ
ncbi:peptidoglycan DD-metalloendopeptidase family protein [Streptomyces sp. NPDC048845]|uniref:peptidoglycan DD-metalloendopeptidase family protein n=1 Tax=Streptomyces sp. NPDC048845 TaxID=3155390 RepID=UPI0034138A6D